MILNIFFMVIVASFLASVFLKYLDLKDSVLAAYVTLSLASLCNWLVLKKPITDVTIGLRWSVLLVIVAEIIFIVAFIQGAVASRMFEPVFNWFSATLLSSGSIKSVLNIYDLGGLQEYLRSNYFPENREILFLLWFFYYCWFFDSLPNEIVLRLQTTVSLA